MKTSYHRFYILTLAALLAAGFRPLSHFIALIRYHQYGFIQISAAMVIPFAATILAVMIGFACTPLFLKYSKHAKATLPLFTCIIFLITELIAENKVTLYNLNEELMRYRMVFTEEMKQELLDQIHIPAYIKVHYYIFSIILIIGSILFLLQLTEHFQRKVKLEIRKLVLQAAILTLYTSLYILGAFVMYEDRRVKNKLDFRATLTRGS